MNQDPSAQAPPASAPKKSNWLPQVIDETSARKTAKQGMVAAFFVAAVTAVVSVLGASGAMSLGQLGFNWWSLVDSAIFVVVAIGIWRMSRVAAVAGLSFFIVERIFMMVEHPDQANGIVIAAVILLGFVNGIRGTFAYRRLIQPAIVPSVPVSPR